MGQGDDRPHEEPAGQREEPANSPYHLFHSESILSMGEKPPPILRLFPYIYGYVCFMTQAVGSPPASITIPLLKKVLIPEINFQSGTFGCFGKSFYDENFADFLNRQPVKPKTPVGFLEAFPPPFILPFCANMIH